MSVVNETVEDRIGVGWVADDFVPTINRKLGGDYCGAAAVTLFEDFEEVVAGGGVKGLQAPVVENDQIGVAGR